jgi:hypothetical protein
MSRKMLKIYQNALFYFEIVLLITLLVVYLCEKDLSTISTQVPEALLVNR